MSKPRRNFVRRPGITTMYLYYAQVGDADTWVEKRERARSLTRHQANKVIRRFPNLACEVVPVPFWMA